MLTFADLHYIHHKPQPPAHSQRVAEVFMRHVRALEGLPRWTAYRNRYARAAGYLLSRAAR